MRLNHINICAGCGKENDSLTESQTPGPGEIPIAMCFHCGHLAIINPDRTLREPTTDECISMHQDVEIRRMLAKRKQVQNMIEAMESARKASERINQRFGSMALRSKGFIPP